MLGPQLEDLLKEVFDFLQRDLPLPPKFRDHALTGGLNDVRDCHVRPDLVLLYRKGAGAVELVRLGSHSDLGI